MSFLRNTTFLSHTENSSSEIEQRKFIIDPRIVPIIVPVFCACLIAALANHSASKHNADSVRGSQYSIDNQTEKIISVQQFVALENLIIYI